MDPATLYNLTSTHAHSKALAVITSLVPPASLPLIYYKDPSSGATALTELAFCQEAEEDASVLARLMIAHSKYDPGGRNLVAYSSINSTPLLVDAAR